MNTFNAEARFNEITAEHAKLNTKFNGLAKHYDSLEDCDMIAGAKKVLLQDMHTVAHQMQALSVEQNALLKQICPRIAA